MNDNEARTNLPEFSKTVLAAIEYRLGDHEDGFSDVVSLDIAGDLEVTVQRVNAALGHLYSAGIAYGEDGEVNGNDFTFLHTRAHDEGRVVVGGAVTD